MQNRLSEIPSLLTNQDAMHSSIITSNAQSSPRSLQNTFSISKGAPPNRSATASTSDGPTKGMTARGSTKRHNSHGQAMRSTFGGERVTHAVRPCSSSGGSFARVTVGYFAAFQASKPQALRPKSLHDWATPPRLRLVACLFGRSRLQACPRRPTPSPSCWHAASARRGV